MNRRRPPKKPSLKSLHNRFVGSSSQPLLSKTYKRNREGETERGRRNKRKRSETFGATDDARGRQSEPRRRRKPHHQADLKDERLKEEE
ncbi:hypothetical protein Scep_023020 [Stephania cephalantha]|uniref:Uncharacterized protein n=1 Tax=Stephania cephalantha TaxID=152367 RepID=A0AAP0F6I2_9MAGN